MKYFFYVNDARVSDLIMRMRRFNRSFTNRLGLLSKYRFDGSYTLAEARVLLEIGQDGGRTSSALLKILRIDPGYLSRILAKLEKAGLVESARGGADRRLKILSLTSRGKGELSGIDEKSNAQVEGMLAHLGEADKEALLFHIREVDRLIGRLDPDGIELKFVSSPETMGTVAGLFLEYASFLGVDLSFQGFKEELSGLPGHYSPPEGAILLAMDGERAAGCVALRPIERSVCEMKRLFVRPEFRGARIGGRLAEGIVSEAKRIGYATMRLDTLNTLKEACSLYRRLGFREIPPYYENPLEGVVYFEKDLEAVR